MANRTLEPETQHKYGPWGLRQHDAEILDMRLSGMTLQKIATHFGTSRESIRNAVARQLFKNAQAKAEQAA